MAELKDKLLRAQAEWDNSRKRIMKDKEEAVRYASEALLEKLLPVLDNFEMGMQAAKIGPRRQGDFAGLRDGAGAIPDRCCAKRAWRRSTRWAMPFDPHRHEALGHQESEEHPEGHVIIADAQGLQAEGPAAASGLGFRGQESGR